MNQLELHHFRCLVTLAEELNFGRAAARLHMSQPPLTRIVSEVERLVGARLFERTTRRVSLTPVGEVFVAEARVLLTRADAAMESVRAAVRRQGGQIRLAYTPLALQTVLPEILSGLREREHEVSIDLAELAGPAQRAALYEGHVDAGFADEPFGAEGAEAEGFRSLLLHREALQVVLPDHHPLAGEESVTLADLAGETFILHAQHEYPRYYARVLEACQEAGFAPKVYHRGAGQNCSALVAAGQGVLLAPANLHPLPPPGFRRIRLKPTPLPLHCEVWAILPTSPGSPYLETLREAIHARTGI
jgi:DNA-binding transcriptional LysR family regulator